MRQKTRRLVAALGSVLAALGLIAFAAGVVGPHSVHFVEEDVALEVREGAGSSLTVRGRYLLHNRGLVPVRLPIEYPIAGASGPDRFEVLRVALDGVPERFEQLEGGIGLQAWIGAGREAVLEVEYRQRLAERRARYVVLTTRKWGRPLERAHFRVTLAEGCVLERASPPIDRATGEGVARDYWPEEDLQVEWTCAPSR